MLLSPEVDTFIPYPPPERNPAYSLRIVTIIGLGKLRKLLRGLVQLPRDCAIPTPCKQSPRG